MGSHSGWEEQQISDSIRFIWFHKPHLLHFLSAHSDRDQPNKGRLQAVVTMGPLQRNIINLCPRCETSGLLQELQKTTAYSNIPTTAFGREASASCWKGSSMAGEWDGGQAMKTSEKKINKLRWIIKDPRNQHDKGKVKRSAFNICSSKGRKTRLACAWDIPCVTGPWDFCLLRDEHADLLKPSVLCSTEALCFNPLP